MSQNSVHSPAFEPQPRCRLNRGFTLVELLVVIGIIALLISILLPSLSKAQRAAKLIACASNMRQVGTYFVMYANDNKGFLPPLTVAPTTAGGSSIYVGNMGENVNPSASLNDAGEFDVWSLLETYYKLSPNSTICSCPQVVADRGGPAIVAANSTVEMAYPNAFCTYRYSQILGGQQAPGVVGDSWTPYKPTGAGPRMTTIGTTTVYLATPWQLGQINSPTTCAMLVETNTPYWKPSYDWANNIGTSFDMNYVFDATQSPYPSHQQLVHIGVAHSAMYSNGSNPDGTPCSTGQGNVLYCDGHVEVQIYHQGTLGIAGGPKNTVGWIDGTAADPDYAP